MKLIRHPKFLASIDTSGDRLSFTGNINGVTGAVGNMIADIYPELKPVAIVHLACISTGAPMHAWENADYFRREIIKATGEKERLHFVTQLRSHLRCSFSLMIDFLEGLEEAKEDIEELWLEQMEEALDALEDIETNISGRYVDPKESEEMSEHYRDVLDNFSDPTAAIALAIHLDTDISNVEESPSFYYTAEGGEYICCSYETSLELAEDSLKTYVEEYVLSELAELHREYFNTDKFIQDVIASDGLGHLLASYDGYEIEINYNDTIIYIYRTH